MGVEVQAVAEGLDVQWEQTQMVEPTNDDKRYHPRCHGYKVEWREFGMSWENGGSAMINEADTNLYNIQNLDHTKHYNVRVIAVNDMGTPADAMDDLYGMASALKRPAHWRLPSAHPAPGPA